VTRSNVLVSRGWQYLSGELKLGSAEGPQQIGIEPDSVPNSKPPSQYAPRKRKTTLTAHSSTPHTPVIKPTLRTVSI
jgi:hypothetical protein